MLTIAVHGSTTRALRARLHVLACALGLALTGCSGEVSLGGQSPEEGGGGGAGAGPSGDRPVDGSGAPIGGDGITSTRGAVRFSCKHPEKRGTGKQTMRRLTRDEYLATVQAVVGSKVMENPAVQQAAAQIPDEAPGDLVKEFQNGHSLQHIEGTLLTAQAVASAVVNDAEARERVLGKCAVKADAACATAFLDGPSRRILKRPLDDARKRALLDAFGAEGGGQAGMEWLLARMLQSPESLFQLELPRQSCSQAAQPAPEALFAWNDADVFFAPVNGALTGARQQVTNTGWFVWQLPGERIPAAFTKLFLELAVQGNDPTPLKIDINLNDKPLLHDVTLKPGMQTVSAMVEIAAGADTKLGVFAENPGPGRTLELRSLRLATQAAASAADCKVEVSAAGRVAIDDWSVASRLSYAFTGRGPDEPLLEAAARAELRTPAQARVHAERLLKTAEARRELEEVLDSWLNLSGLPTPNELIAKAAGVEATGLAEEARRELLDYVTYLTLDKNADVGTLLSARIGFPRSERLAKLYGSAIAKGNEPVELKSGHGGLLLRIAPLLSGQLSSSPILRGVYVRKRMMCDELPAPDFSVVAARTEALDASDPKKMSGRQIVDHITSPPGCMSCHKLINPIGYALEEFGPLGQPRKLEVAYDHDGKQVAMHPINTSVTAANLEEGAPDTLSGSSDLLAALAEGGKVRACIAERFYTHAQLRNAAEPDGCALAEVEAALRQGKTLREAWLLAVVNEDLFYRQAEVKQ